MYLLYLQMVNCMKSTDFMNIKLGGVTQGEAQQVIKKIVHEAGVENFTLIREPNNHFDPHAVKVECCNMYVGYIPQIKSPGSFFEKTTFRHLVEGIIPD